MSFNTNLINNNSLTSLPSQSITISDINSEIAEATRRGKHANFHTRFALNNDDTPTSSMSSSLNNSSSTFNKKTYRKTPAVSVKTPNQTHLSNATSNLSPSSSTSTSDNTLTKNSLSSSSTSNRTIMSNVSKNSSSSSTITPNNNNNKNVLSRSKLNRSFSLLDIPSESSSSKTLDKTISFILNLPKKTAKLNTEINKTKKSTNQTIKTTPSLKLTKSILKTDTNSVKKTSLSIDTSKDDNLNEIVNEMLKSLNENIQTDNSSDNNKLEILETKETKEWKGEWPLEKYNLNKDSNPVVIKQKPDNKLTYSQSINIKYLSPPSPPKPGDIIIKKLPNRQIAPAPPLILRQEKPRPKTPIPLILREEPPKPPEKIKPLVVYVPGKILPPPSRKVVLEKLPELPSKPQSIYIEKWLPYKKQKRKVIYERPCKPECVLTDPKNLVIEWETPEVEIKQEVNNLGVEQADPVEYAKKFRHELKKAQEIPKLNASLKSTLNDLNKQKIKNKQNSSNLPELEGDIEALVLIDLDKCGLSEYKDQIKKKLSSN